MLVQLCVVLLFATGSESYQRSSKIHRRQLPLMMSTPTQETEKPVSARASGLALQLDEGTRKSHSIAENTQFVTGFFKGLSNKESFATLVTSLYFVYEAMESCFDSCTDPRVKKMNYLELLRGKSLEVDMEYYFGADWKSVVKPSPATVKYVNHIKTVASTKPFLLVAHQYTRYLGDLFGKMHYIHNTDNTHYTH